VLLHTCDNSGDVFLVQTQFQGLLNMQTHPSRGGGSGAVIFGNFQDGTINIRAR
jgi:hypothetical protein